jgi:hypothetical protein
VGQGGGGGACMPPVFGVGCTPVSMHMVRWCGRASERVVRGCAWRPVACAWTVHACSSWLLPQLLLQRTRAGISSKQTSLGRLLSMAVLERAAMHSSEPKAMRWPLFARLP